MLHLILTTLPLAIPTAPIQDDEPVTPPSPPDQEQIDAAVLEGAQFLLGTQERYVADAPVRPMPDDDVPGWQAEETKRLAGLRGAADACEWPYQGVYRVRGDGGVVIPSGYRVGGTSIVCEALMTAHGGSEDMPAEADAAIRRSLDFVLDRLANDRTMAVGPKRGYDVRGWGHAYALRFLQLAKEGGLVADDRTEAIDAAIGEMVERLEANQTSMGGWNYAGDLAVSPFMTGATLLILFDAVDSGVEVPADMVERALDALEAARTDEVSYAYSGEATGPVKMPGSSARSAVAELALYKAGRSGIDDLRRAVDGFFVGWDDLLVRKSQQGTHVGPYGIAPYYFFFGHTYVAMAIEELPEAERAARRAALAELIWRTRDEDGSWNDRIFPRSASYATAMVILALRAPEAEAVPAWSPPAATKR